MHPLYVSDDDRYDFPHTCTRTGKIGSIFVKEYEKSSRLSRAKQSINLCQRKLFEVYLHNKTYIVCPLQLFVGHVLRETTLVI